MKLNLGHLLGLTAIIVAGCAAFFSVYGLSQLFAGASLAVIVMASALELSKLVAASFLHNYWGKISKLLRIYLTVGVVVLVMITSAGIYGFLSNAFQKTAFDLEIHEGEVSVIDGKVNQFKNKITTNIDIINSKDSRISQLSDMRSKQEVRLDSMINRRYFSNANATRDEIGNANQEIQKLSGEIDELAMVNSTLSDSISKYEIQKLEMRSSSNVAAEVGPLKYLAELINKPMAEVVNYFILLLILVFDPLAISLVIATNWYFKNRELENELEEEEVLSNKSPNKVSKYKFGGNKPEKVGIVAQDVVEEDSMEDEVLDEMVVETKEEVITEKPQRKPLTLEDIGEIRKKRGFSVPIDDRGVSKPSDLTKTSEVSEPEKVEEVKVVETPKPKDVSVNNSVTRIGSNKYMEQDSKIVYSKNGKR